MSRPIPVLLSVRSLTAGGSERQMTEMALALDRRLWTPHVACFHDQGERAVELRQAGIPILRLPVTSFLSASAWTGGRMLAAYLRTHRIGVMHSFDTPANLLMVPWARWARCPAVFSSQRAFRDLNPPRERLLLRVTDRLAHGIVVNCEAVRNHLTEDERVDPARIHLCHNGLDAKRFHPEGRQRQKVLKDARLVIGAMCVLRPEKGLPDLLEAFALIHTDHPGVHLALIGSGPLREPLEEQARLLGVRGQVHFEPATPDVEPWLSSIDIFVQPSHSEAFSNSVMEAMASGCAVIASAVGGNPELVDPDRAGLVFPARDKAALAGQLRRVIQDPALRQRLATEARRRVSTSFSLERAATRLSEIYQTRVGHLV